MFLFQSPSIFPLNRFIRLHGVNHNQPFPTANQELIWFVSSLFLWLLMVKMSDFSFYYYSLCKNLVNNYYLCNWCFSA